MKSFSKKILTFMMAAVLGLSLCGCLSNEVSQERLGYNELTEESYYKNHIIVTVADYTLESELESVANAYNATIGDYNSDTGEYTLITSQSLEYNELEELASKILQNDCITQAYLDIESTSSN